MASNGRFALFGHVSIICTRQGVRVLSVGSPYAPTGIKEELLELVSPDEIIEKHYEEVRLINPLTYGNKIYKIALTYFPMPTGKTGQDFMLIPVWNISVTNKDTDEYFLTSQLEYQVGCLANYFYNAATGERIR